MKAGIYFNPTTNEITSVTDGDELTGSDWL